MKKDEIIGAFIIYGGIRGLRLVFQDASLLVRGIVAILTISWLYFYVYPEKRIKFFNR